MSEKYHLGQVMDYQKWDEFVEKSEGSIFFKYSYLKLTKRVFDLFYIFSGTEPRAGVLLIRSKDLQGYELDDSIIYNGIFYANPMPNQKKNGIYSERFKLLGFLIEEIVKLNKKIKIAFSPSIIDIRPVLWFNYSSLLRSEKFSVNVRYTSYLNISEFLENKKEEEMILFQSLDMKRRQSIRKARKLETSFVETRDPSLLINYYIRTMESQGNKVEEFKIQQLYSILKESINEGFGKIFIACNEKNEPVSIVHFLIDSKKAYYLYGATNPEAKDDYCGTLVLWDSFQFLGKLGIKEVDLEGINSPNRGWFKLSFGGEIIPYFEVKYENI